MKYAITVNSAGRITGTYMGAETLPAPWITISAIQYGQIVLGSTWSGNVVVAPTARI